MKADDYGDTKVAMEAMIDGKRISQVCLNAEGAPIGMSNLMLQSWHGFPRQTRDMIESRSCSCFLS